ncbi:FixH family protein [Desulfosporosinus sp. SYSU MS00001]|uniref:FixH family protein n=1 Tax=Desulfosporosinus sp. SYSU MS00001 TaxID=3416284 RepID=UPI003CF8BB93
MLIKLSANNKFHIYFTKVLIFLLLLISSVSCGKINYQYSQEKSGTLVEIAISPYPQKSLTPTKYTIHVTHNGHPIEEDVKVTFQMKEMEMGDDLTASSKGNGNYEVNENLDMPGTWDIIINVSSEKFTFETTAQ